MKQIQEKMKVIIKNIAILILLGMGFVQASPLADKDFDGVPDSIDECPNTPFLNEVNALGCTTQILILPFETNKESLLLSLSYGYSTNEDLRDREKQRNSKIKINYYHNGLGYSLQTGYYSHQAHSGMLDTIVRVRKRFKLNQSFSLNIGTGLRLPTYDFTGNKIDGLLYTSLHHYVTESLSVFAGYNYTYIGDKEIKTVLPETPDPYTTEEEDLRDDLYKLQNVHKGYLGAGYFFTKNFYMNIMYSIQDNKFSSEHRIRSVSSSIYYKINDKWFSTLYYKRDVKDGDLHDNLLFSIGYTIW